MCINASVCLAMGDSLDSGTNINPKIPFPKRYVLGHPPVIIPEENCFVALSDCKRRRDTVQQLVAKHFVASKILISVKTVQRKLLLNKGLYARAKICMSSSNDDQKSVFMLGKRTSFLIQAGMGFCTRKEMKCSKIR